MWLVVTFAIGLIFGYFGGYKIGFLDGHVESCTKDKVDPFYIGEPLNGRQGIYDKFGIQVVNAEPARVRVRTEPPLTDEKLTNLGQPMPSPCSSSCSTDFVNEFIDQLASELKYIPASLMENSTGYHFIRLVNSMGQFECLYPPFDVKYDRDHNLNIDIDGNPNRTVPDGTDKHRHIITTKRDMLAMLFYTMSISTNDWGPASNKIEDIHQYHVDVGDFFADYFLDPTNGDAKSEPRFKAHLKALLAGLEETDPVLDNNYWDYIAKIRGKKRGKWEALSITPTDQGTTPVDTTSATNDTMLP
jgi:hypothetical protein